MSKCETKEVKTKEELKELYDDWSLTVEGLSCDDESLNDFAKYLDTLSGKGNYTFYIIKGKTMNNICQLSGKNAYPDDLTIVSVKNSSFENVGILTLARFEFGGRWMYDIIDNNAGRQGWHPFNSITEDEENG